MMRKEIQKKNRTLNRGFTIAYIGKGKGKTTAAVGVVVRAVGYGWKTLYFQFCKSTDWPSGERGALRKLGVDVRVRGEGFVGILGDRKPRQVHKAAARRALAEARKLLMSGRYRLVVLDELISCVEEKLLTQRDVTKLLNDRARNQAAKNTHVILTGHRRYPAIERRCDLVTEMRAVRHPYSSGIQAVQGIDF